VAAPDPHAVVIACFDCGTELAVSPSAQSTMCKRCSSYVDLADYKIAHSVSKNFRTKGTLVIEESGYLFNSETTASRVVLKGRFIGKLKSEGPLEIHPKAKINGTLFAGVLVIPPETVFTWPDTVEADRADIAGELIGDLHCLSTATLRAGARVFGNVTAGGLVIEDGAVLLGQVQVKPPAAPKRKA
jgi:cytoskeletal protein CcmA (bactofilin family)